MGPQRTASAAGELLTPKAAGRKLEGKDSQSVVNAPIKNARKLPQELYKSLT